MRDSGVSEAPENNRVATVSRRFAGTPACSTYCGLVHFVHFISLERNPVLVLNGWNGRKIGAEERNAGRHMTLPYMCRMRPTQYLANLL